MPREDRRIIFDYSESYKAIYALSVQKELRPPPPGAIKAVSFKPGNDQVVLVRIDNPQEGASVQLEFTRDFIAAALMRFCRTCNIPLPKKALKSVDVGNDALVLRVMI